MCGIACIISKNEEDLKFIKPMTEIVSHRGPDDEGVEIFKNVAFGHRRLSIIDLSEAGHQPMKYMHYYIIYNGEVFNFKELKEELINCGYTFKSNTDTEVVCAAYDKWGLNCNEKFNGFFSFIIYDTKKDWVFLSRDRYGVKPLYYWESPNGYIAFASEIKQFTMLPGWNPKINETMTKDFLVYGYVDHTDETLFKDVFQIYGGTGAYFPIAEYHEFKTFRFPWYKLSKLDVNEQNAVNHFKDMFIDSVKLRLISDVPVGSCLSGGLDSSSIVCVIDMLKGKDDIQKTFSSCSKYEKFDEKKFVDIVVNDKNIEPHYVYADSKDLIKNIENIIWHQDSPLQSTSLYAQYMIFQTAHENGIKVMLDGQGADEVLFGYYMHFMVMFNELFTNGHFLNFTIQSILAKSKHDIQIFETAKLYLSQVLDRNKPIIKKVFTDDEWIDLKRLNQSDIQPSIKTSYSNLDIFSKHQIETTSLPALLHWEDRNSMAFSIESRTPFLDYRIVNYVYSLPREYKINYGITKRILRDSMKGILPDKIRKRMDKMGFVTPEEIWIKENKEEFRKMFLDTIKRSKGIIKEDAIKKFDRMLNGEEQFTFWITRIITFGIWLKVFNIQLNE